MIIRQRLNNTRESVVICDFCLSDEHVTEGSDRSDSLSVYKGFRYSTTACGSSV